MADCMFLTGAVVAPAFFCLAGAFAGFGMFFWVSSMKPVQNLKNSSDFFLSGSSLPIRN
jgi:hypothetical protein